MCIKKANVTENLRARAEALLTQASESFLPADIEGINKLHHELAVHQAELELQNEELRNTQLSLQQVRDLHVQLYEHAPVGYVLLDAAGMIRRTNATWRAMLKQPDDDFCGTPFAKNLLEEDARIFLSRYRSLFHNPADKQIELRIKRHNTKPFYAQITAKRNVGVPAENNANELMVIVSDITERKQAEIFRDIGREILQILNESGDLEATIQRVLTTLKTGTKVDCVGLRLQDGDDFPYFAQDGFSADFLQTENTLLERRSDGGVCRDKDGNICLECTCGLVISGKTDVTNPLFTKGGSCWTNDSLSLINLPSDQDPRTHPRNICIHQGFASIALIPVRASDRIVGLIQLNDKRKDRFTLATIEMLEDIAAHIGSALMRKRVEEELRESEERFKALHNASFGGIAIHDQGVILDCNQGLAEMSGFGRDKLIGMEGLLLIAEQSRETVMSNLRSGYEQPYEAIGVRRNGEEYPLRLAAKSIPYNGRTVRIVEFRDITERKRVQWALEEKNKELEQFVYIVSHDLKSPLVTVKTFAVMLRQDLQSADQQQMNQDLNYIDKAADKMQQLLDALLQYSRIDRSDTPAQTLTVADAVENCLTTLAGILQQHQVQVSTGELTQQLKGDALHFEHIWQNLIENAVKYRNVQVPALVEIGQMQQGHDVVFYVQDNGRGIAPEQSERIFELFCQLSPGSTGSGLGLALVKKIVSIYQGRIWVESTGDGQGSCFKFTLPGALLRNDELPC
ncbi:MAG TPA: PAS domain S-box protein [Pelovirga sp.]|nr:PAS domain S-box protein [Pelovirga sp.]